MKLSVFLVIVVLGLVSTELSENNKATINNGLTAAKELSDFLENGEFKESLTKLASAIGPYLGAIGPVVGFILGLFGSQDSAELTFMKEMLKHIDNRFDHLESRIGDLDRKIDYIHTQVQFGIISQKIIAVSVEFAKLYNAPHAAAVHQKQLFITNYESDFQNSGQKLYDGIMNEHGVFTKSIGEAAMDYYQNDRRSVQQVLMGSLKLLLQAVKLELAYLKAKGFDANYQVAKKDWEHKIAGVRSKMISIDNVVAQRYYTQADSDIERFITDHTNLNNNDFSSQLYHFLVTKYFWRDWMVIVYKDIVGEDKHYQHECEGFLKFHTHSRNIVISSVDKTKANIDITSTKSTLLHLAESHPVLVHCISGHCVNRDDAATVFNRFPSAARTTCSPYASVGVVRKGSDQYYQGPTNRLVHIEKEFYSMHMFG